MLLIFLGFPSIVGKNKKFIFNIIKDKVWEKINSWSGKAMFMVGREVLIKSVAQAILTNCVSIFQIPPSIGEELQKLMNYYW